MSRLRKICRLAAVALLIPGMAYAAEEEKVSALLTKGEYIPDIATFLNIGACVPAG